MASKHGETPGSHVPEFTRAEWDTFNRTHGFESRLLDEDKDCLLKWVQDATLPRGHVLEVGCAWGGTSAALIRANAFARPGNEERWFGVDPYPEAAYFKRGSLSEPDEPAEAQHRIAPISYLCGALQLLAEYRPCWLHGTLGDLLEPRARQFRLAFIDGDHSYEGVRSDTAYVAARMIHPGGVIILHDCTPIQPGVWRYWNELCDKGGLFGFVPQGIEGYCGVLRRE